MLQTAEYGLSASLPAVEVCHAQTADSPYLALI